MIDHDQKFRRPEIFQRGVITENKLKTPKIFKTNRCFFISITTVYIRWAGMLKKSIPNHILFF